MQIANPKKFKGSALTKRSDPDKEIFLHQLDCWLTLCKLYGLTSKELSETAADMRQRKPRDTCANNSDSFFHESPAMTVRHNTTMIVAFRRRL